MAAKQAQPQLLWSLDRLKEGVIRKNKNSQSLKL